MSMAWDAELAAKICEDLKSVLLRISGRSDEAGMLAAEASVDVDQAISKIQSIQKTIKENNEERS